MRLTSFSDYTLRVLIYLALNQDRLATIQSIADSYGISENHLMKVVHRLAQHGFVETVRGRGGGLRLGGPADGIRLGAVVRAVDVPVTLKIRTGIDPAHRNALAIARIAESAGISALAVHGRTRACAYVGPVEYETIRAVKRAVTIPVIANGDIRTPEQAARVLAYTGADAIMIGRAAQGRPWIFREIDHYLASGTHLPPPTVTEARAAIAEHLDDQSVRWSIWTQPVYSRHS